MQEFIEELLLLQEQGTSYSTSQKGLLVRESMPRWLRDNRRFLDYAMNPELVSLSLGTPKGALHPGTVPWLRVATTRAHLPGPGTRWLIQYFIASDGSAAYLALLSDVVVRVMDMPALRAVEDLRRSATWARSAIKGRMADGGGVPAMSLASKSVLFRAFEESTVLVRSYPSGRVATDDELLEDLDSLLRMLSLVAASVAEQPLDTHRPILSTPGLSAKARLAAAGAVAQQLERVVRASLPENAHSLALELLRRQLGITYKDMKRVPERI